jgi:uncharacterized protein (UPF0305 family)
MRSKWEVVVVVVVEEEEEEEERDQRAERRPSLRKKEGGKESFRVCVRIYVWLVKKRGPRHPSNLRFNGGRLISWLL